MQRDIFLDFMKGKNMDSKDKIIQGQARTARKTDGVGSNHDGKAGNA